MKVSVSNLEYMRREIAKYDTPEQRDKYRNRQIPRADSVKDINKRYRWDLYYHCARMGADMPDSTYGYNMAHIDTALRAIVEPL